MRGFRSKSEQMNAFACHLFPARNETDGKTSAMPSQPTAPQTHRTATASKKTAPQAQAHSAVTSTLEKLPLPPVRVEHARKFLLPLAFVNVEEHAHGVADRPVAAAVRVADGAEPHGHGRATDVGQAKLRGPRAVARDGRRELPAVFGVDDVQKRMAVEPLDVIGSVAQMLIKKPAGVRDGQVVVEQSLDGADRIVRFQQALNVLPGQGTQCVVVIDNLRIVVNGQLNGALGVSRPGPLLSRRVC